MTILGENRKAFYDYEIVEEYEAGIELLGFEVKSAKAGKLSLQGSYVIVRAGQAFLAKALISPYQENNTPADYDSIRERRLILSKKEIAEIESKQNANNLTVVPVSMYTKGNLIKIKIAVAKGKKKYDKRESIKKRETDRSIRREFFGR